MKIQIITGNNELNGSDNVTVSDYSNPISPDGFDVNVIDLSYVGLWKYNGNNAGKLDNNNDLKHISKMISDSNRSRTIYVYPQDAKYLYDHVNNCYRHNMRIKDLITSDSYHHDYTLCFPSFESTKIVVFESTVTTINNVEYTSAFRFDRVIDTIITKSEKSNKITTIKSEKGCIYTTLDICSSIEKVLNFVETIFGKETVSDIPDWVQHYEFGSDKELRQTINSSRQQISDLQKKIDNAEKELSNNNRYKSILVNNGDSLVEVVFDILEKLLDCDLSSFVDEKKEDFRIEKESLVFIGEIKGITSNVKNENISQLDVHYQSYLDEIEDEHKQKDVKAILIINPLRNKMLEERDPVNERQIELAKRNGSLIIETVTLLKMFELFTNGVLSSERCLKILEEKTGILSIDDLQIGE